MWVVSWERFDSEVSWIVASRAPVVRMEALMANVASLGVNGKEVVRASEYPTAAFSPDLLR